MVNDTKNENQPGLDDLISLSEAAELSGLSTRHLRHLGANGDIWAKKLGRNWFTTEQAIKNYLSLNVRPGRKTSK